MPSVPTFRDLLHIGGSLPRALVEAPRLPHPRCEAILSRSILLVCPFYRKSPVGSHGKHVLTPSQALSSLAAVTPEEWSVAFWDENLLQGAPPDAWTPEIVGITVHLTFSKRACELATWFRARGSVVIMGGPHLDACAEELLPHADALVLGNGVAAWRRVLEDHSARRLQTVYRGAWEGLANEPLPARSILPPRAFLTPLSLIATRGCHNRCDFCWMSTESSSDTESPGSAPSRMRREARPVEQIVREFTDSDAPYGVFIDNNLGSDRAWLHGLCEALNPLDRIWSAAVSLDVSEDPSLVRAMAKSGCTGVFIGFESLNSKNLLQNHKRGPDPDDWLRRVELFHDVGIQVNGSFLVGFDHDGPEVFREIADWVEKARLECATYHILTPYPGTPLFKRLETEGRLLHKNWDLYDTAHCVFQPARMTPEILEQGLRQMYERTFSSSSIWRRRPTEPSALLAYLGMSLLYKRMNPLWPLLIRAGLVKSVWGPLVEASRRRHLRFRKGIRVKDELGREKLQVA